MAEAGAKSALESLAVHHYEPFSHMSLEDRRLRDHLQARARQLGDMKDNGNLDIYHLVQECAYEHWHRMLFARFLAENGLLIEPESGVAISLDECKELAESEGLDLWTLASRFAQKMLPQIFRPDDPVLRVAFAHEHQLKLENELNGLETEIFIASDALGWVYQFWQAKRKEEVNDSGIKIGADELPAVTQLFTEPYMVEFLIHNTLGAWHAGKMLSANPELAEKAQSEDELRKAVSLPGVSWDYLRFIRTDESKGPWRPAAGVFEGWPKKASELKIIDPCCGSGHFLVAVLYHLVPIRMIEEGISVQDACEEVLKENLSGLEIDERCTQIAAFALAFAAWTYPGADGYRNLPKLQIACSGIAPNTSKKDWINLAGDNERFRNGLESLYDLFKDAPSLGSLIDPIYNLESDLLKADFNELRSLLRKIINTEKEDHNLHEIGISTYGITEAVQILDKRYNLIITNVPYLARIKQTEILKEYCTSHYKEARNDISTVFLYRLLNFNDIGSTTAVVLPQSWFYQSYYKKFRKRILATRKLDLIASLGSKSFQTQMWDFNVILLIITASLPKNGHKIGFLDASTFKKIDQKSMSLCSLKIQCIIQAEQLKNPDYRISKDVLKKHTLLDDYVEYQQGICTGDYFRFGRFFWEIGIIKDGWVKQQCTIGKTSLYGGLYSILYWEDGKGELYRFVCDRLGKNRVAAWLRGGSAWGSKGVAVSSTGNITASLYTGTLYNDSTMVLIPKKPEYLSAIWSYVSSNDYEINVRKIDKKLNVRGALIKVPFDYQYWKSVANSSGPISEPYSDDPTQWIYHGHINPSFYPIHVAIARLAGYKWPAENDSKKELSLEAQTYIGKLSELNKLSDDDGIICMHFIRGEDQAVDRLRKILAIAYGNDWSLSKEQEMIASTGSTANDLDEWLRNDFFEQHCKLFHHRPFIWHIWDGRKRDGFHALVNYHKLAEGGGKGKKLLETLTYSYLGDWINRQKDGVKRNEDGAEDRLAAAVELQKRLIAILEGEPPFDVFVRWKPVEKQPVGWNPDINDGVRINIRPFMASDIPGGKSGAGVLRWKPNINWSKDRGKEPDRSKEQFPWFWKNGEFTGDRINDVHLANSEKLKARERAAGDPEVDINV